jgi:hypothetical protein
VAIVLKNADACFHCGVLVNTLKRLKFTTPVLPGALTRLELDWDATKRLLSFRMTTPDGATVFSAGSMTLAVL